MAAQTTTTQTSDGLLVGSALGLMAGLFLMVVGCDVMETLKTNTYPTVLGLEMIDGSMLWIGAAIAGISILGIAYSLWKSLR